MKVADCDSKGRFDVSEVDVSATISGGGYDNDFHCPVTGHWVVLKMVNGQIWCTDRNCSFIADTTMTIPDGVFE